MALLSHLWTIFQHCRNKTKHIIHTNQDLDLPYKSTGNQATNATFWTLFATKVLFFVFIVGALTTPRLAHAGVVSFVSGLFSSSKKAEITTVSIYNSQTIPILRAALNVDPNPSKGGGDVIIKNYQKKGNVFSENKDS